MNLALALASGDVMMIASDFEAVRTDRHLCAGVGAAINFFYLAAGCLTLVMAHSIFKSITGKYQALHIILSSVKIFRCPGGVIGGRTHSYMSVGWGLAFIGTGANVFFHLHDFGDDPRCMVGWKMEPKVYFLMPTVGTAALAIVVMAGIIGHTKTYE